jgi:predicted dehydrogenase
LDVLKRFVLLYFRLRFHRRAVIFRLHRNNNNGFMNRRRFLQASMVGAAAGVNGYLGGAEAPPARIKIGFLGTAHAHFREKLKVVRESPDFDLVGLCEENETARAKGPTDGSWMTRDALFGATEVIVVESAVRDHAAHAKAALAAGKHVHVEKPPAPTLQSLRELLELAREKRRLLQIGYMWRHNPGINAALEAAREGWLGAVFLVRAAMNTLGGDAQRLEWGEFPGGAMFEQGCHLIDALVRLLGKPSKVSPFLKHHGANGDSLADNTVAVFEFPRALGIITSAPLQPNAGPHRCFEVIGSNGTARVQPLEPPGLTLDLARPAGPYPAGVQEVKLPVYRRYVDEFAALAAAIRARKPLSVSSEEELTIHETLLRACEMR